MNIKTDKISELEYIQLTLENCENFYIDGKNVLCLDFPEVKKRGKSYYAKDGRIVIAAGALNALSSFVRDEFYGWDDEEIADEMSENSTLGRYTLFHRLVRYCDVCSVQIKLKSFDKPMPVSVPYDPLMSVYGDAEVDLSNCPSCDIDADGNMIILFGKSSRAYRRKDNDYASLILGFSDEIKKDLDRPLKIEIKDFGIDNSSGVMWVIINSEIINNGYEGKPLSLAFEGVEKFVMDIGMNKRKCKLLMSRTSTGEIFVQMIGRCEFTCLCVKTYAALHGKSREGSDGGAELNDVLACRLSESEMEYFARNRFEYPATKVFTIDAFDHAVALCKNGDISVKYLSYWLRVFSRIVLLNVFPPVPVVPGIKQLGKLMSELSNRLVYFNAHADCAQLVEDYAVRIKSQYINCYAAQFVITHPNN